MIEFIWKLVYCTKDEHIEMEHCHSNYPAQYVIFHHNFFFRLLKRYVHCILMFTIVLTLRINVTVCVWACDWLFWLYFPLKDLEIETDECDDVHGKAKIEFKRAKMWEKNGSSFQCKGVMTEKKVMHYHLLYRLLFESRPTINLFVF